MPSGVPVLLWVEGIVVEWLRSRPSDCEVRGSNPGQGRKRKFLLQAHPSGGEGVSPVQGIRLIKTPLYKTWFPILSFTSIYRAYIFRVFCLFLLSLLFHRYAYYFVIVDLFLLCFQFNLLGHPPCKLLIMLCIRHTCSIVWRSFIYYAFVMQGKLKCKFIPFIHSGYLYSAPSRNLLRGAQIF